MKSLQELENFFNSVVIPKNVQLYPTTIMFDAPEKVKIYLDILRTKPLCMYTRRHLHGDLMRLEDILAKINNEVIVNQLPQKALTDEISLPESTIGYQDC